MYLLKLLNPSQSNWRPAVQRSFPNGECSQVLGMIHEKQDATWEILPRQHQFNQKVCSTYKGQIKGWQGVMTIGAKMKDILRLFITTFSVALIRKLTTLES